MTGPLRTDYKTNEVYDAPAANATNAVVNALIAELEEGHDLILTGPPGQAALNTNVLVVGNDGIDTMAGNEALRTASVHIIATAGITAGAIIFEGSNDNANWTALPWCDLASPAAWSAAAVAIAASANRSFLVKMTHRWFRVRVSTAFVGGSVQAVTRMTAGDISAPGTVVSGSITNTPVAATIYKLTTAATTNFAVITSSTSVRRIGSLWAFNPTAATAFIKLYSKTTTLVAGDVPVITVPVPAGQLVTLDGGLFGNGGFSGFGIGVTANADAAAATAMAAAGVQIAIAYTT